VGDSRRSMGTGRLVLLVTALTLVVGAAVAIPALLVSRRSPDAAAAQLPRVSGLPANMPTRLANLMAASALNTPAPGFTLTDQKGRRLSLASLRGKVVVLQFMDPHCTDICPIVSAEYLKAHHDLGATASKVVFAAINVNQYHAAVADMAAYSRQQGLTTIPGWHFFTGPVPALKAAWQGFHIEVQAPNPDADVVHTSVIYFIDARGRERYLAMPEVDHTKSGTAYLPASLQASWGHGIALLAASLAG
jgi:cytochrome oxidase Cu insertion factor (SCO1/SenC/PrrC family)